MRIASRTVAALAAIAVAVSLSLAGCAGRSSELEPQVTDRLQSAVLEVSQLAAEADYSAALVSLDEFEADLKDARARGAIPEERYESILAVIVLVRADLQAAIDAQAPVATESPAPVDDGQNGDEAEPGNNDNGNQGKDKGKKDDKGKGKGKGKGED